MQDIQNIQNIRETVSQSYARALAAKGGGCCGPGPKGILARQAGYAESELATVPGEAVSNSFGCGNPLAFSEVMPGQVVLDLGCGAGIDVILAAARVGPAGRVIGVDMTDPMVAKARQTMAEAGLENAEIRKGLIEELPVESASVDWVISNCVINLSPEKSRVFAEMSRVLRPGGRVLVSDLIAEGLSDEVRGDLQLYSCCVSGSLSEAEYRAGLEQAGLDDVRVTKLQELDLAELGALVESDRKAAACCGSDPTASVRRIADACSGRVWSATISARKPQTG